MLSCPDQHTLQPGQGGPGRLSPLRGDHLCEMRGLLCPLLAVGLCGPSQDRSQGCTALRALAAGNKLVLKTLPIAQAFDSTIDINRIFTVLRPGDILFVCFSTLT